MLAPLALGRGAVVSGTAVAPYPDVVEITDAVLEDPAETIEILHHHWLARNPVSVVLTADPVRIRTPLAYAHEPYTLTPAFTPWLDRLHFLIWANNVDLRSGKPVWWWGRKALRIGAAPCDTGDGDVILHDTTLATIANQRPVSLDELSGIAGLGPVKLARYGAEILATVAGAG